MQRCFKYTKGNKKQERAIMDYCYLTMKEMALERYFAEIPGYEITKEDICNCFCETNNWMKGMKVISRSDTTGDAITGKIVRGYSPKVSEFNTIRYVLPQRKLEDGDIWERVRIGREELELNREDCNDYTLDYLFDSNLIDKILFNCLLQEIDFSELFKHIYECGSKDILDRFNPEKSVEGKLFWFTKGVELSML